MRDLPVLCALALVSSSSPAIGQQAAPVADAVIDLRTTQGVAAIGGQWRYTDVHIRETEHRAPGPDLRPSGPPVRTHDIHPRINTPDFDAAPWQAVDASSLEDRRTNGRLAFGWYTLDFTVPSEVPGLALEGSTLVLEVTVDDYAEIWVNGSLRPVLGQTRGGLIAGWNAPARVLITRDAMPGQKVQVALLAVNGPLSEPPGNYVWIRSATLDIYKPGRGLDVQPMIVDTQIVRVDDGLDAILAPGTMAERIASGFSFGEGPVWVPAATDNRYGGGGAGGYLLFSDPNKNVIHRYEPTCGDVTVFRTKSGYSGVGGYPLGRYHQPGSNGLALDREGRLTICEHGNRRVTRLEPNGALTVMADVFDGRRLNSPNDCVYRSDGSLYFTDPPFGLPQTFEDPARELPFSGVYCIRDNRVRLVARDLAAPNGLAFSPDERHLYVDNWEEDRKVVMRYDVASDGSLSNGATFYDMTSRKGEICLDGLKTDRQGNLLVSGPGGIWIISPTGKHLGTLSIPELPANFAFGDEDGQTLYMTARTGLYRIRMNIAGAGR